MLLTGWVEQAFPSLRLNDFLITGLQSDLVGQLPEAYIGIHERFGALQNQPL
jgi:hypothetical protein